MLHRPLSARYPFLWFAEPDPTDTGGGDPDPTPGRTFTQDEVNAFLAKELGPLRQQIKDLKPAADRLAEIEDAQKTELEKLTARAEAAEQTVAAFEAEKAHATLVDAIATEKKLDGKAKALLAKSAITDEDTLRGYADDLAGLMAATKVPTPLYAPSTAGDVTGNEAAARARATALLKQPRS